MITPTAYQYDPSHRKAQVEMNRQSNFKMSFDPEDQFGTAQAGNSPNYMRAQDAHANRVNKLGSSNIHQVQIGHTNQKGDYKSLTALQQAGHADGPISRNQRSNYTEVRA